MNDLPAPQDTTAVTFDVFFGPARRDNQSLLKCTLRGTLCLSPEAIGVEGDTRMSGGWGVLATILLAVSFGHKGAGLGNALSHGRRTFHIDPRTVRGYFDDARKAITIENPDATRFDGHWLVVRPAPADAAVSAEQAYVELRGALAGVLGDRLQPRSLDGWSWFVWIVLVAGLWILFSIGMIVYLFASGKGEPTPPW